MALASHTDESRFTGAHQKIALITLAGLLFLRLPVAGGIGYVLGARPDWLDSLVQLGTYLLTAFLIWWERDRLADFHIDGLAIAIIIVFKPIQTIILTFWGFGNSLLALPNLLGLIIWVLAFGLALALFTSHPKLPKPRVANFLWLAIGAEVGMATAIVFGIFASLQINQDQLVGKSQIPSLLVSAAPLFIYQIGYAAVTEEPLFRGFLWGYLRKMGWKDVWIWLFQAGLFSLAHIYYLNEAPISFWVIVPAGGLVLGLLAWRSHSITTSMTAHGMINALASTVGYIIATFRL